MVQRRLYRSTQKLTSCKDCPALGSERDVVWRPRSERRFWPFTIMKDPRPRSARKRLRGVGSIALLATFLCVFTCLKTTLVVVEAFVFEDYRSLIIVDVLEEVDPSGLY